MQAFTLRSCVPCDRQHVIFFSCCPADFAGCRELAVKQADDEGQPPSRKRPIEEMRKLQRVLLKLLPGSECYTPPGVHLSQVPQPDGEPEGPAALARPWCQTIQAVRQSCSSCRLLFNAVIWEIQFSSPSHTHISIPLAFLFAADVQAVHCNLLGAWTVLADAFVCFLHQQVFVQCCFFYCVAVHAAAIFHCLCFRSLWQPSEAT